MYINIYIYIERETFRYRYRYYLHKDMLVLIYIYIYVYSPGQQPNGVLDPEQQIMSATSYQYAVIFSGIPSILSRATNDPPE